VAVLETVSHWGAAHVAPAAVRADGVAECFGEASHRFALASVTKLFTAYAVLIGCEEHRVALEDASGPAGSTLAHLLSHASGLAPDDPARPLAAPGARRIYSNAGFAVAGSHLATCSGVPFAAYLAKAVFAPLAMGGASLDGSPAAGATATLDGCVAFAAELLRPTLVAAETMERATSVAFPGLAGIVPGFGSQDPCDWGLGFELRAAKSPHRTGGRNSPRTFGHFGGAGGSSGSTQRSASPASRSATGASAPGRGRLGRRWPTGSSPSTAPELDPRPPHYASGRDATGRARKMKGVLLAGGTGSRLDPLTRITNKHLLPVYDRPMISYAVEALVKAGIDEMMVVTGGTHAGEFLRLLSNGEEYGVRRLTYAYQDRPGGIAQALGFAERFVGDERVLVMLADNVFGRSLRPTVERFGEQAKGARIVLARVAAPEHLRHLGVPELDGEGRVVRIVEKPDVPPSEYCVTGVYCYEPSVFSVITTLVPSSRGELEITDVNNYYVAAGEMSYDVCDGFWGDAGESIDAYYSVVDEVRRHGANRD
jgi:glucose-1-phosphate thymidylyltransferase